MTYIHVPKGKNSPEVTNLKNRWFCITYLLQLWHGRLTATSLTHSTNYRHSYCAKGKYLQLLLSYIIILSTTASCAWYRAGSIIRCNLPLLPVYFKNHYYDVTVGLSTNMRCSLSSLNMLEHCLTLEGDTLSKCLAKESRAVGCWSSSKHFYEDILANAYSTWSFQSGFAFFLSI